jgi:predicted N-formylglutamate amidohydrolase
VEVVNARATSAVVLLCDHASNRLPEGYGTLGLPPAELERHIGYDIGAAAVTQAMAERLGATAVLSRFSRLLIDPNRGLDDPTLIMRLSDGAVIPGNRHLDEAERRRRIDGYYAPYHAEIAAIIDGRMAGGVIPVLLSVHSFTAVWKGTGRPWHAAVLWDKDPRLAVPLIDGLRREGDLIVGDNEPYTGKLIGDTLWTHGTRRGLAHAIVEIRQDLISDAAGQQMWAGRLARLMTELMAEEVVASALGRVDYFGSHTDPV